MSSPTSQPGPVARPLRMERPVELAVGAAVLVLATLTVYGPALSGDILWDDDQYVSDNPLLFAEDGLWRIWFSPSELPQYYPLTFTSFWIEERLWGLSTGGVHLVNVLLHAVNVLLVWSVMRRLEVPGAWLAAAMFALHPVHVESVAWITERKNVLSGTFYVLAALAYLRFADHRRWALYALALLLFAAALLSKTATVPLPAVLLLVLWWKRPRLGVRDIGELLPFFAVGLAMGIATIYVETEHVGAAGDEWALNPIERVLLAGRALWFYLGKLLWPAKLAFNYPRWSIDAAAVWQYAFPLLAAAAAAALWRWRGRIGKAAPAALGCYLAGLAPVLGFFNVYYFRYSYVADHFQYHASIALLALIAAGLTLLVRRLADIIGAPRRAVGYATLLVPLAYGLLAFNQAGLYRHIDTLWSRTIALNPNSWLARYNLAIRLVRDRERDDEAVREATDHLRAVLEINPRCDDAHMALGNIARGRGRHAEAMAHYDSALALNPANPRTHYNVAREWDRVGERKRAVASYRRALACAPRFGPAHNSLGRILLEQGEHAAAAERFGAALRYDPRNVYALHNMGMVREAEQRSAEAIAYYQRAVALNPGLVDSWFRMGVCLRESGDLAGAVRAYEQALAVYPGHADALADLAAMDHDAGRLAEAAGKYRRVVALSPDDVQSRRNLSWTYRELGQYGDALALLERGLKRRPDDIALTHDLARLLATCPDHNLRDGPRAVRLAQRLVERVRPPRPEILRTLAQAHAVAGEPGQAIQAGRAALALAESLGLNHLAADIHRELDAFESGGSSSEAGR